jgi:glycosyltransferase involved in cell wall biosynthesis
MKIAVLSFTSGQISRGVETVVRELEQEWKKRHEVQVISAESLGMKVDWEKMTKGNSWRMLMLDYYHLKIFWFTVKALKKVGEVDFLIPVNGGWQSLLCRLYSWLTGIKLVIPGLAGLGWCDRWNLLMRPDVFVASTKRNAKWARKYSKGVKIEIAPHGVDLKRFSPEGKRLKSESLEKLRRETKAVVLCVAGPDRYKRVEATIKAMVKVKEASLLLVGGSDEMEKLGKRLLGKRFLRMKVEYKDLDQVYRACDVFTMVSESTEEFGIVNLEALASGLPMVVTDDELRRELLGEFGIYVKDVWGEEYSKKLEQACNKGRTFVTQRREREGWLERFGWERIAKNYEEMFEELV